MAPQSIRDVPRATAVRARACALVGLMALLVAGHCAPTLAASAVPAASLAPATSATSATPIAPVACSAGTLYLTLDTGNMRHAQPIADILARHRVKATFFMANEKTDRGDYALGDAWAPYWRARVAEGHAFGSHTWDHVYFRGEARDARGPLLARAVPQFGPHAGRTLLWDAQAVCGELRRVDARLKEIAGRGLDPLWRAPGGRAPPFVMRAGTACGFEHVHWSDAGLLGDELPSQTYPNDRLLARALSTIRDGDVLMAHLGIRSRLDPFAPALDPLIEGLMRRGFCFATLSERPMRTSR